MLVPPLVLAPRCVRAVLSPCCCSFEQARSLGAAFGEMRASQAGAPDVVLYTVHFSGELSGVAGFSVWQQAEFVNDAVRAVQRLHKRSALPRCAVVMLPRSSHAPACCQQRMESSSR